MADKSATAKVLANIKEATQASDEDIKAMLQLCNGDVNATVAALLDSPFEKVASKKDKKAQAKVEERRADPRAGRRFDGFNGGSYGGGRGGRGGRGGPSYGGGRGSAYSGAGRGGFGGRGPRPAAAEGAPATAAPAEEVYNGDYSTSYPETSAPAPAVASTTAPAAAGGSWGEPAPAAPAPSGGAWGSGSAAPSTGSTQGATGAKKTMADLFKKPVAPPAPPKPVAAPVPAPAPASAPAPSVAPPSPAPTAREPSPPPAAEEVAEPVAEPEPEAAVSKEDAITSAPAYQPATNAWGASDATRNLITQLAGKQAAVAPAAPAVSTSDQTLSSADNAVAPPQSAPQYGAYGAPAAAVPSAQDKPATADQVDSLQLTFGNFGLGGSGLDSFGSGFGAQYAPQQTDASSLLPKAAPATTDAPVAAPQQLQHQPIQQQQQQPTNYGTYTLSSDKITPAPQAAVSAAPGPVSAQAVEPARQAAAPQAPAQPQQPQQAPAPVQQPVQQQAPQQPIPQQQQPQQPQQQHPHAAAAAHQFSNFSQPAASSAFGANFGMAFSQPQQQPEQQQYAQQQQQQQQQDMFASYSQADVLKAAQSAYNAAPSAYGQPQQQAPYGAPAGATAATYNPSAAKYAPYAPAGMPGADSLQQAPQQVAQPGAAAAAPQQVAPQQVQPPASLPQALHYGQPAAAGMPPGMGAAAAYNAAYMNPYHQFNANPAAGMGMYGYYGYPYQAQQGNVGGYPPQPASNYAPGPASTAYGAHASAHMPPRQAYNPYPGAGASAQGANVGYGQGANAAAAYGLGAGYEDVPVPAGPAGSVGAAAQYGLGGKDKDVNQYGMAGAQGGYGQQPQQQQQHGRGGYGGGYGAGMGGGQGQPGPYGGYNQGPKGYGGYGGRQQQQQQYGNQQYGPPGHQNQGGYKGGL